MNIVVIGSCTDSSTLAKELNKRLHNSIVARIDLLKNIKQLVFQNINVEKTAENIGTYVGDVEIFDYSKVPTDQKQQIIATIESITKNLKSLKNKAIRSEETSISTFDALTNSLPSGTYSFIKIYSGAIDDEKLVNFRNSLFLTNSIFIKLNKPVDY
jgi:predicted HNH restriction endonuclease